VPRVPLPHDARQADDGRNKGGTIAAMERARRLHNFSTADPPVVAR
jgi:hypothetical protein